MFDWWDELTGFSKSIVFLILTGVLSTLLMVGGMYSGNKELIVIFGIIRLTATFFIILGVALVGMLFGGRKFFASFISCLVLSQLMTTFLASVIPLHNVPRFIPVFLIGMLILAALGFWHRYPAVTIGLVLVVLGGIAWAAFSPGKFERLQSKSAREDRSALIPRTVRLSLANIRNGSSPLFGPKNEPLYWFALENNGDYTLFEVVGDNTIDPRTGDPLRTLDRAEAKRYVASLEKKKEAEKAYFIPQTPLPPAAQTGSAPGPENEERSSSRSPGFSSAVPVKARVAAPLSLPEKPRIIRVAVILSERDGKILESESRRLARNLCSKDILARGDLVKGATAYALLSRLARNEPDPTAGLSLEQDTDFLVIGFVSEDRIPAEKRNRFRYRVNVAFRVIPLSGEKAALEWMPASGEDTSAHAALDQALQRGTWPVAECLQNRRT